MVMMSPPLVGLRNGLQGVTDDGQTAVKVDSLLLGQPRADSLQHAADFVGNSFAGLRAFVRQDEGTLVSFGGFGFTQDVSVLFKEIEGAGNRRLVLLAPLTQVGGGQVLGRVQIVEA